MLKFLRVAICAQPLPLRGFDEEVRNFVAEQYGVHGLHLHPAASPVEIRKGEDGKLTLVADSKTDGQVVLQGLDHVLMATGRKPNTRNLGCEEVMLLDFPPLQFLGAPDISGSPQISHPGLYSFLMLRCRSHRGKPGNGHVILEIIRLPLACTASDNSGTL